MEMEGGLKSYCGVRMIRGRILIVEDEYFIADHCADLVRKAGFAVAGPFYSLEDVDVRLWEIDGALLDINLRGASVYPLLDDLLDWRIPVTLYTGYALEALPAKYAGLSHVLKPNKPSEAVKELCRQIRTTCLLRLLDRGPGGFCKKRPRRD
jgi:CheY-like chemotaxis protein